MRETYRCVRKPHEIDANHRRVRYPAARGPTYGRMKKRLLILDDDKAFARALAVALRQHYAIETAHSAADVRSLFAPGLFDAALVDLRLDSSSDASGGLEVLRWLKSQDAALPVLVMSAFGDVDSAVESLKLGASDFIQKSRLGLPEYRQVFDRLFEQGLLRRRALHLEQRLDRLEPSEIVSLDAKLETVRQMIDLVAEDGDATVLIRGETGTGKELVARAIHRRGVRRDGPLVVVAIPTLPESTVASELFGHEKGAYTGAEQRRIGLLEEARGGVLLLDEIGDLPFESQILLLRFLESREVTRLGSNRAFDVDVQVLAATHQPLEDLVAAGRFREDLYYRIKGFEIMLPPLRERRGDIELLARHFLDLLRLQGRTAIHDLDPATIARLSAYAWPGNVRELKQAIGYATLHAKLQDAAILLPEHLPPDLRRPGSAEPPANSEPSIDLLATDNVDLPRFLGQTELGYIAAAWDGSSTQAEVADALGYRDRYALRRRVHGILDRYPDLVTQFPVLRVAFRRRKRPQDDPR